MATQMPEENRMAARTFREKEKQESRVFFSPLFLMFRLAWITEKELGSTNLVERKT